MTRHVDSRRAGRCFCSFFRMYGFHDLDVGWSTGSCSFLHDKWFQRRFRGVFRGSCSSKQLLASFFIDAIHLSPLLLCSIKKILSVTASATSGRSLVKRPQSFYHRIISGGCACCSLRKERFLFQNRSKQSNLLGHCETLRNYFIPELEITSKYRQEGKSIG